jgi:hypothetical protein
MPGYNYFVYIPASFSADSGSAAGLVGKKPMIGALETLRASIKYDNWSN